MRKNNASYERKLKSTQYKIKTTVAYTRHIKLFGPLSKRAVIVLPSGSQPFMVCGSLLETLTPLAPCLAIKISVSISFVEAAADQWS